MKALIKKLYSARPAESKKYDYGLLIVIGGSEFYSGAPALSGLAGFRAGVDMVRVIAPQRAADIIASFTPDLAAFPLDGDYLEKDHVPTLLSLTKAGQQAARGNIAVVIGGGLGRSDETKQAVIEYLFQIDVPVIIDADAIHAVAGHSQAIMGKNYLATPHAYEFFVLTGKEVKGLSLEQKIAVVKEQAMRLKATILLKGKTDIIASSDGKTKTISGGTTSMTVGGTGDTLAGIAGALMTRGVSPLEAGAASAFINGKAGELATKKYGAGMTASDLIDSIPRVIP